MAMVNLYTNIWDVSVQNFVWPNIINQKVCLLRLHVQTAEPIQMKFGMEIIEHPGSKIRFFSLFEKRLSNK